MNTVNTVAGGVESAQLGKTLMHEHIFVLSPEIAKTADEWNEEAEVAKAVERLRELKQSGIDTLVDLTVIGLGQYMPRIKAVVDQVPEINVIAATGVYTYNDVPMYFHFRGPGTAFGGREIMTDYFVHAIEHGFGETGIRAGILKCATDAPGITPGVERVLRAVAQAHRQTGKPITTHAIPPDPMGLEQQRIFREEGVDLTQVVIGHSGGTLNIAYHEEVIANGSYVGLDHFGTGGFTLEQRLDVVATLCERGHADRIVISHDAMCYDDWLPQSLTSNNGDWTWTHIPTVVVPAMRARGISEEHINLMLVDNPRRILEGCKPY